MKKKNHFLSNKNFLKEILKYKETKVMSNQLGAMIMLLAKRYASDIKFSSHKYFRQIKEDAVSYSIECCIRYIDNFDPNKYDYPNPFAFFTQIVKTAFMRDFNKEKRDVEKNSTIKQLYMDNYFLSTDKNGKKKYNMKLYNSEPENLAMKNETEKIPTAINRIIGWRDELVVKTRGTIHMVDGMVHMKE